MESKDELKEIDIKNRTCYYFDDIIGVMDTNSDFDFSDTLLGEKCYKENYKNILIYDISGKTLTSAKQLRIRLYVLVMSRTRFRVNPLSTVA